MRLTLSAFAAVMMIAQPVLASTCTYPQDVAALKVASLKSELMVTAITCQDSTRYNKFMLKFQPDLVANERVLQAYFTRAYGRTAGARQHDIFITNLANAESTSGITQGTNLCFTNEPMFDEVMALPSGGDLPDYAAGKNLAQPLVAVSCADVPVEEPKARVIRHRPRTVTASRKKSAASGVAS